MASRSAAYATAITLSGSRDDAALRVTDVVIRNNIFRSIGQISKSQKEPSTAVVRLVNADRVQIVNNRFQDIRNRQTCNRLHAVYVAHGSTDNLVQGNAFQDGCGDAVRFRDRSSGNRVVNNTFIDFWVDAPISDWYCDSTLSNKCTKRTPECPSFDNEIAGNRI
ncbi:MAG: right-handed parallel beta-helix repeat-containing protein [Sphingobium sp.]|nr:right-handed parallel beta-helix repeat-containing protein [Sphingobium sp.]